ncbi:hypothetical protein [Sphingobium sp. Z007]|nr:hypothetical protein [Sphingobium sp. Z007]
MVQFFVNYRSGANGFDSDEVAACRDAGGLIKRQMMQKTMTVA